MKTADIQKMPREELLKTLKELRLYRDLQKELGSRGIELFKRIMNKSHRYQVEHFDAVSEDLAWNNAQEVFKKVFDANPKRELVEFTKKEGLKGGIKVYLDDEVVDLSFDKVERTLRNS